ncbi:MAG TPA: lytic transglycosylase domain-containing protein [Blastocatellia bacterium]|nr:lytic transglycosylase domain-containing protein [Blastocatellia bacterium]
MKLSVFLAIILLLGIAAGDARAQEPDAQPEAQRTPVMTVQEAALPVQNAKTADPKAAAPQAGKTQPGKTQPGKTQPGAQKKGAAKPAAAGAQSPATPVPPPPVLMSGATAGEPQLAVASVSTSGNPVYDEMVMKAAARHGVDPNLIFAVMRQESGFNPRARSYKGASGLMQLMPATARRFGVSNIYDPAENIEGGVRYLRFLLDMFNGDVELALAGYNAGEGAVIRHGYAVPRYRETQHYVKVISARYGRDRHRSGRAAQTVAQTGPVAPSAITFSGGGAGRLSNNY